jgi:[acyl-carrier-protein] S-malonyltransferase
MSLQRIALVFPGQGSQVVGMGKALYAAYPQAKAIMETVQANTLPDLLNVCFDGPEATLLDTRYTQPALLAVSLGAWAALKHAYPALMQQVVVTAGHSLGEYGALVAAGVLTPEAAARLVRQRAQLMSQAQAGAMAVVMGLSATAVRDTLATIPGTVVVANDNSPEQVVISGEASAIEAATAPLKAAGAKRVMPLAVSGAFHSPLMQPAAQAFAQAVAQETFSAATVPVITNTDAAPTLEGHGDKLCQQIAQGVQWTATMQAMVDAFAVDTLIELGSGKVLTGLMKKTHPTINSLPIGDPDALNTFLASVLPTVATC